MKKNLSFLKKTFLLLLALFLCFFLVVGSALLFNFLFGKEGEFYGPMALTLFVAICCIFIIYRTRKIFFNTKRKF